MSFNKIALIGATGNVGPAILKALLEGGFEVTILSREGSTSTDSLASHPKQKIVKVNFEDVTGVTQILKGIDGLVSNVASSALLLQKTIIDAAIAAGVKRFLPSDFGADLNNQANRLNPFNMPKVEVHTYLEEKVKTHPEFSYTSVVNGPFLDWCLRAGLYGDLQAHEMTLWDGGENRFSTTTLASVGKAVVGIFRNPEATKNKVIRIADTTITQKDIIEIVKEIDGKEWTTKLGNTAEAYQIGLDEMKKSEPNWQLAVVNQLYSIMFSTKFEPDFGDKLDNDKIGLPVMTKEQVKEVVKNCLA